MISAKASRCTGAAPRTPFEGSPPRPRRPAWTGPRHRYGRRQPKGHVTQHLHQHAAQAEGHHLAETRIGHRADNDLHAPARNLLLDLHPSQHRVGLVRPGVVHQGPVRPLRLLPVRHPHQHAAGLGLVQDVFRDDLHHHRETDVRGQIRGLRGRPRHAFPRQRDTVDTQHLAAFQRRQRGPSLGLHALQNRADLFLSTRACLHRLGPPCLQLRSSRWAVAYERPVICRSLERGRV